MAHKPSFVCLPKDLASAKTRGRDPVSLWKAYSDAKNGRGSDARMFDPKGSAQPS